MSSILTGANPLLGIVGYGVGSAMGPILRPPIQDLLNESWQAHPVRPLSANDAAALWVEGVWSQERANTEGEFTGIDNARMSALHDLLDNPPDVATLFTLWRRGFIGEGEFETALQRLRIEPEWHEGIKGLHNILLPPDVLANARQQGFVTPERQYAEALLQGVTNDRAEVQFLLSGNPPGPETLLDWWRRKVITEDEFEQGLREGRIKTKYTDEYKAVKNRLLTAHEVVNLRLRGWIDDGEMNNRGLAVGYDADTMHDMFLGQGRPVSFRQVFIGKRRGGTYNGSQAAIDDDFLKSLQESNIRPEWYNIAWAQRESLPSAFVLRSLTQSGDIEQADALRLLLFMGWPEWLAEKVSAAWALGGTAEGKEQTKAELLDEYQGGFMTEPELRSALTALGWEGAALDREVHLADARRVKSQRDAAITFLRGLFVKGRIDAARATTDLTRLGVVSEAVGRIVEIWTLEREAAAA